MESGLSGSLNKFKWLNFRQALLKNISGLLALNLFALTTLFALDNLTAFSAETRFFMLTVFLFGNLILVSRQLWRIRKECLSDRQAALKIEKLHNIKDNALINAVCFREDENISPEMRSIFETSANRRCAGLKLPRLWQNPVCIRTLKIFTAAVIIAVLYIGLLHRYAYNAALRFVNPWTQLASLNFTQFQVKPGDMQLAAGTKLQVTASAARDGKAVNNLKILLTDSKSGVSTLYPMHHSRGKSVFTITNITANMTYKVISGKDSSRNFNISIIPKPEFEKFDIKVIPPVYTGLKPQRYDNRNNEISAPQGSEIIINAIAQANDTVKLKWNKKINTPAFPCSFKLITDASATASVERNGIRYPDIWRCNFKAVIDKAPQVRFLNRQLNIEAGIGQNIPIYISAEDDYGIRALRLVIANQGRKGIYKQFGYIQSPPRNTREAVMLKLTPQICSNGTVLELSLQALDSRMPGQTGQSEANITIHVVDMVKKLKENLTNTKAPDVYKLLFQTLEKQQEIRNWLSIRAKGIRRWELYRLTSRQQDIKKLLISAAKKAEKSQKDFSKNIRKLADKDAAELINTAHNLAKKYKNNKNPEEINQIIENQSSLIMKIKSLLGMIAAKDAQEKEKKELMAEEEQEKEFFDKLKNVRDKLKEFMTEQKKIIAQTEAIDKKEAEDWTDAEEKLLGDLAARELEWSKLFKAAFNDLSKLQNQDFSNSAMADEFVEMYEELQTAGDALNKKKKIEIATLAENTAMNSSVSVAANLDRWLADNKDYIKWTAEESGESPDIPMTDLPAELTDIIGDLIETEDDMGEDTQDSTNSFSYSSDEGLGWGVSDGNIDSMQAKGITGNVLPNNNEVGGRSGEGRSGKSSGQFVEKTATGKGGRKTPTRLTQSPYEKGSVEDISKDPQGGASGGGKQSGTGGEGLIGVTPDQDPDIKERLSGSQGELRQRAEALLRKLGKRQLPTGDLREALNKMAQLKKLQVNGSPKEIRKLKGEISIALKNARTALILSINAGQEKVRRQKMKNFTVKYQEKERIPPEYQDCVRGYFKALAKEE